MSELEGRKFEWDFEGIPFLWNPEQPRFSVLMNEVRTFHGRPPAALEEAR